MFAVILVLGLGLRIKIYTAPANVQLLGSHKFANMHQLLAEKIVMHM
jgi:hypothetical protein